MQLEPETEALLKKILDQYEDKEMFVRNLATYQISELRRSIINIEKDLEEFEKQYSMSTEDFYEKFNEGLVSDEEGYLI
jgi:hypothetical protein